MSAQIAQAMEKGVQETLVPAIQDTEKALTGAFHSVADGAEKVAGSAQRTESEVLAKIEAVSSRDAGSTVEAGSGSGREALKSRLGSILDPEAAGGQDVREMATETPGQGWKAYNELSPKAKNLARRIEKDGVVSIGPGEVGAGHLGELTGYFKTEVAVGQNAAGDLKLFQGEEVRTVMPPELRAQGYEFTVHTHPEDARPGELTEIDKLMGKSNSMAKDLDYRARGTATHIEAVVNRQGDFTFFDHTGILPTEPGRSLPGGPINGHGFVVPVPAL